MLFRSVTHNQVSTRQFYNVGRTCYVDQNSKIGCGSITILEEANNVKAKKLTKRKALNEKERGPLGKLFEGIKNHRLHKRTRNSAVWQESYVLFGKRQCVICHDWMNKGTKFYLKAKTTYPETGQAFRGFDMYYACVDCYQIETNVIKPPAKRNNLKISSSSNLTYSTEKYVLEKGMETVPVLLDTPVLKRPQQSVHSPTEELVKENCWKEEASEEELSKEGPSNESTTELFHSRKHVIVRNIVHKVEEHGQKVPITTIVENYYKEEITIAQFNHEIGRAHV